MDHFLGSAVLNILPPGNGPEDCPYVSRQRIRPMSVEWLATGEVRIRKRLAAVSSSAPGGRQMARTQLVAQNGDLLELCIRKSRENAENCESENVFVVAKKWNSVGFQRPIVGCVWDSEMMAGEYFNVTSVNEALRDVIEMPQVGYRMTICRQNMHGDPIDLGSSDEFPWTRE